MNVMIFKFMFKRASDGKEVEGFHHFFSCIDLELPEELLLKIAKAKGYDATRIVPITEEEAINFQQFVD